MYNRFFGFKERPFKLVPNPEYLFLSRIHEEVLAHLNYAVGYGEGFVEITGEVGTGKTTLCRMFLENLDEHTAAAYIFNPKLDALQLLKAINDEFGIPSDTDSVKTLIDRLNTFLLEQKARGRRVILLVDEAQNLSADVLEQLRLLSNLETTTSKLLQIILVGQPELGELLESEDLRQLNQRITLSCHLIPLGYTETREYIHHRIHIASRKPDQVFTTGACRAIYKYAGGVPRLINIACDRALLTAFTLGKHQVSTRIVKRAVGELDGHRPGSRRATVRRERLVIGLLVTLVVMMGGLVALQVFRGHVGQPLIPTTAVRHKIAQPEARADIGQTATETMAPAHAAEPESLATADARPDIAPAAPPPSRTDESAPASAVPPPPAEPDLTDVLAGLNATASRIGALTAVLDLWGREPPAESAGLNTTPDDTFFNIAARHNGLECLHVEGNFNVIRKLNLPAILAFPVADGGGTRFMAVVGLTEERVRLSDGADVISVPVLRLDRDWRGDAYILWKNYHNYQGVIPVSSPGDDILALKVHLKARGYPITGMTPAYDIATRSVIEAIQARNGLQVDGKVGPQTKIAIYNEDPSLTIPRLMALPDE